MSTRNGQNTHLGAAANNSRRTQGRTSRDKGGATIIGTGIAFVSSSTITDSGNGFAAITVGDMIEVLGSPLNSRLWHVAGKSSDGQIAVRPQLVQSEIAGPSITITRKD